LKVLPRILSVKQGRETVRGSPPPRLRPGDLFRAKVLEIRKEGDVLLSSRGVRFQATTARPLKEGSSYHFQVRDAGERILLNVVENHGRVRASPVRLWAAGKPLREKLGPVLGSIAAFAGKKGLPGPLKDALRALQAKIGDFVYEGARKDVEWPARQLKESGIFLESRAARRLMGGGESPSLFRELALADLKGILLSIKAALGRNDTSGSLVGDLAEHVEKALQALVSDQEINLAAAREGLGWFWHIPGRREDGFLGGEAFVQKEAREGEEISFSMSLEFSRMGRMDFLVTMTRSSPGVRILVGDEEKAALVGEHLEELRNGLAEAGLEPGTLVCRERREEDGDGWPFREPGGTAGFLDVIT